MREFVLSAAIFCLGTSSIHLGVLGNPMRYSLRAPRITDNIAIVGKLLAVLLSLTTIFASGSALLLIPFFLYVLGAYLFAKKTALKGRIMIWSLPYDMASLGPTSNRLFAHINPYRAVNIYGEHNNDHLELSHLPSSVTSNNLRFPRKSHDNELY